MSEDSLFAREAIALRLRLESGLASVEEAALWADAWLLALEKPSDDLVDLSLGADSVSEAVLLLRTLSPGVGEQDDPTAESPGARGIA